ncbi:hypothetical protein SARC_11740 [Sphaeroforma arctica JP610]|uniref:Periplasmic binding protein domain-containing protein n=1 Tax=Sphaeroforma arctica JP610 TaxID=667725 RepID=A0A0L0FGZ9_9EUKA|nr:hypothetical protein SARC_11740 [Sphaeroforma arctica JP610]KNC75741.1 hypothetical protein SARC_11740 [Sphaeroforma arctica JP610]|eukprot:XP_014149643.1 hypothetical protein SARC_11740 [Sphaeroforma arctica JP610]
MTQPHSIRTLVSLVIAIILLIVVSPSSATPHRRQDISDAVTDIVSDPTNTAGVEVTEVVDTNTDALDSEPAGVSVTEFATDSVLETDTDSDLENVSDTGSEGTESDVVRIEVAESNGASESTESDYLAESDRPLRFAVVAHSSCEWDESWCEYERAMERSAETFDVTLDFYSPANSTDFTSLGVFLDEAIDSNPDGIALTISNETQVLEGLTRAKEAGISVMAFESGPELAYSPVLKGLYLGRFGMYDYRTGLLLGQVLAGEAELANFTSDMATGFCINDRPTVLSSNERCNGIINAFNSSGYSSTELNFTYEPEGLVADRIENKDQIAEMVNEAKENGFQFFLIAASGDKGAEAFYEYMQESGLVAYEDFLFVTFGSSEAVIENILTTNQTAGAISDQPYYQGAGVINALNMNVRYGIAPVDELHETGPIAFDAEDANKQVGDYYIVDGPIKLIAIQHGSCEFSEFWCTVENGIHNASTALGVETDIRFSTFRDPNRIDIAQLVEDAIAEKPDGLLVTIPNADALRTQLQAAVDAGIPVIAYNAGDSPSSDKIDYLTLIAQDNYLAGQVAGEALVKAAQEKGLTGKAVCISADPDETNLNQRCLGFEQVVEAANFTHVRVAAVGTDEELDGVVADYYTNYSDTDIWLTATLRLNNAFYDLIDAQGLTNGDYDFVHGAFDVDTKTLQAIEAGVTEFTVDQHPYIEGYDAVAQMVLLLRENVIPATEFLPTGPGLITAEDVPEIEALAGMYRRSVAT